MKSAIVIQEKRWVLTSEHSRRATLYLTQVTNEAHQIWSIFEDEAIGFQTREQALLMLKELS